MSHTPEPWKVGWDGGLSGSRVSPTVYFDNDAKIREVPISHDKKAVAWLIQDGGKEEDLMPDANRIVACVNGCAGLNPDAYRECVEALQCLVAGMESVSPQTPGLLHIKKALAHAKGEKGASQ